MSQLREEKRYSSAKSYQDTLDSSTKYSGTENISYSDISRTNLHRYEAYLLENDCMCNTISTYIRCLYCIYNKTVGNGDAECISGLFQEVFIGVESKRKKSLSLESQHKLITVKVGGEVLGETQLAVCLLFRYVGMSFVDFAHLKEKNIKNEISDYNWQKTGTPTRLEILDMAELICKELMGDKKPTLGYLSPSLSGTKMDYETYLEYSIALSRLGRNSKALKKATGITSGAILYTVHHSFAMALKKQSISIEMISELLGCKSTKIT